MRLNTKLSLLFFLMTVIPVLIVSYISFYQNRIALREHTANHLVSANLLKKAEFERWVRDNALSLEILAKSPFFKENFSSILEAHDENEPSHMAEHRRILGYLQPTVEGGGGVWELFIIRAVDGRVMISTDHWQESKFLDNQPYFIQGKAGTFIQNVYYAMSIQQPAMTIGTPLKDSTGNTIAVLAGRLDLSDLSAIMEKRSGLSRSEDTYLVNKFNFYVTEPRFGEGYALKKSVHTQGISAALAGKEGVGFYQDYRGVPVIGAYQWMPEWELCLITEVDQAEADAPVLALRRTVMSIAAIIALLAAGLGWLSAYTVTTPLRRLVGATETIALDKKDINLDIGGGGEVADLARAFERMFKRLASTLVARDALLAEIEERKKAERLRESTLADLRRSNEELQQFAYVASHDLQEPLRMVSSYTQLLAERYEPQLDDRAKKYIHYAVDGAVRMQRLIQDLLTYSRITTKGGTIEPADSKEAFDNAVANLQAAISDAEAVISHDALPQVMADPIQVTQLFQNLIGNAIKFRGVSPPRIHVSADRDGQQWRFSVADNGIGIDPQYGEKIFVIFQRLHTRREYPGTGIGLAICKRIVQRHGGDIWFVSEPRKGSSFHFTMKAA